MLNFLKSRIDIQIERESEGQILEIKRHHIESTQT